jgi:hypothetical protein
MLIAAVCGVSGLAALVRTPAGIDRAARIIDPLLSTIVWLAALLVFGIGVVFGVRAAGGSDPYGYVSQAQLWLGGHLHVASSLAATVPWPDADWTFAPLGYRPAAQHTLVPTYPPGLPLVMALCQLLLGHCGPFLVAPMCGGLLVLAAARLGTVVAGRVVGTMAALCTATSPTVLYMTVWTMSDVPAATSFVAALWLAFRQSAVASGVATGIGIMIRPNLAPLAVFPLIVILWPTCRLAVAAYTKPAARFVLSCTMFVLVLAWTNYILYGSPLQSGYGSLTTLYSWEYLGINLSHYRVWLAETQSPLVFVFLLAVFAFRRGGSIEPPVVGILFAFTAAVVALYAWYQPFTAWWFLRFLLPALPVIFVMGSAVVWSAGARCHPGTRVAIAAGFTFWMALYGVDVSRQRGVFTLRDDEQKYADVGRYIAETLPGNAVVLAMQHSGSIRLYSGRLTLRYDLLASEWLDKAIDHLASMDRQVYVVLENGEVPAFKRRFESQQSSRIVDRVPLAVDHTNVVRLYGVGAPSDARVAPAVMPVTFGYSFR